MLRNVLMGALVMSAMTSFAEQHPGAATGNLSSNTAGVPNDLKKRSAYLAHLLKTFNADIPGEVVKEAPIWESWLRRTGELPPDFDRLPSHAFPPDLLRFQNGKPVAHSNQWPARKEEIKGILKQYMFGNWPPAPSKIAVFYRESDVPADDRYTRQTARVFFSPSVRAVELAQAVYGIRRYSHLRPTLPRLGLFLGHEKRIPYDFQDVIGLIAPRPVFILAPKLDQDWVYQDVETCYREAARVYELYGKKEQLRLVSPNDFNRYPPEYQETVNTWLVEMSK